MAARPSLRAITGPVAGSTFPLSSEVVIGRSDDVDIPLADGGVSRQHAVLTPMPDGTVVITDTSKNGTFISGRAVTQETLAEGDTIRIGKSQFVFETNEEAELEVSTGSRPPVEDVGRRTTVHDLSALARKALQPDDPGRVTQTVSEDDIPAECDDSLHEEVRRKGWGKCPACGKAV